MCEKKYDWSKLPEGWSVKDGSLRAGSRDEYYHIPNLERNLSYYQGKADEYQKAINIVKACKVDPIQELIKYGESLGLAYNGLTFCNHFCAILRMSSDKVLRTLGVFRPDSILLVAKMIEKAKELGVEVST
jgi:hypothetical protein